MMDRTPSYRVQTKTRPLIRVQGWREEDFRGTEEVEAEEDLVEVGDS